ncbi:MAG: hypothetical protein C4527_22670 [Candidatus Omnitrophota bacterium]|jgi:L-alanine-DL-glutamate epimerase-like enolase superfamily enzyme|nr:MAG: hypothetical protein C4527_22670 [Candidatus Omnitrophota bacterium]
MKIERVEAFPVLYPTIGRFKFLEGPDGKPLGRPAVLVKITTDDGTVGWGESVPVPKWSDETLESATSTIRTYLTPALLGRDPFDIAGAHEAMNRAISPAFSTGMPLCKAGVDMALHDLCCRFLKIPLARYWGRQAGGEVLLSWTLNPASLDHLDDMIEEGWKRGYRNFNVKVAPDPKYDIELCRRVKERVPDGFLWADANCGYNLSTALEVAPKLADVGVAVLEAPLRPNELSGYQRLKHQAAIPIIMDEGVVSPRELVEFIRLNMLDGVAMKPARCGGLLSARRQIEILLDAGMLFLGSGLTDPDISLAASLALYSAYGLSFPAALNGPQFLAHSVIRSPFKPIDGKIVVPQNSGLGFEVDEKKIEEIVVDKL